MSCLFKVGPIACLLVALAGGCTTIGERLARAQTALDVAQATADFYVKDGGDESCSVAIVSPGGTVFASAGSADAHTLFRLGSLSKFFLLPVLEQLQAEGRLDLDRAVTDYSKLPLPAVYRSVTLRDLLLNRSGLPREFLSPWNPLDMLSAVHCGFSGTDLYAPFEDRAGFARQAGRLWWRWQVRPPRPIYSNVGFGLLGMTVEDALGEDLETLLRRKLAEPLALSDTAYTPSPDQCARLSRACAGHLPWLTRRGENVPDHRLGDALRATGGLLSSTADCATVFAAAWPILDERLKRSPLEDCEDDAVYGLLRVKVLPSGRRILYRVGMIYGGASFVGFDPLSRTVVVILRNVTSWPDDRGFAVMSALEG